MIRLNKVQLTGAVGADAEIIALNSDKSIVKVNIAISDNYKDKEGNWVDNSHWFRLVFLIPTVVEKAKEIKKGDKVYIEGKLVENKYTNKEGKNVSTVEVHVMALQIEKKSDAFTTQAPTAAAASIPKPIVSAPTTNVASELEDDLPF